LAGRALKFWDLARRLAFLLRLGNPGWKPGAPGSFPEVRREAVKKLKEEKASPVARGRGQFTPPKPAGER